VDIDFATGRSDSSNAMNRFHFMHFHSLSRFEQSEIKCDYNKKQSDNPEMIAKTLDKIYKEGAKCMEV
jgi:hypothetical protein